MSPPAYALVNTDKEATMLGADSPTMLEEGDGGAGHIENYKAISPKNAPAILCWKNLTVTVPSANNKVLLHGISGCITGGFWAIMGSSGGGKTTLLNTLSLRLDSKIAMSGEMMLNGRPYEKSSLKTMSAYVMQDDVLMAELSVAETMAFTAALRMDKTLTQEEKTRRSDYLLKLLGISHTKDVIVGNTLMKGISGGERKRLCIAMELLDKPAMLFLDEPTSGLDSFTSLAVCDALRELARSGECTVVCTIHQPQQQIFEMFDNLILMKRGHIMYQGNASKSLDYLSFVGMDVPLGKNPADFLLDMLSKDDLSGDCSKKVDDIQKMYSNANIDMTAGSDRPDFREKERPTWFEQVQILLHRNLLLYYRRWDIFVMNLLVAVFIGFAVSTSSFMNMGNDQQSVFLRQTSLNLSVVSQGVVASIQSTHSIPMERALTLRERSAGSYYISAYFTARTIADLCFQIWPPIIFSIIAYNIIGYQDSVDKFFIYLVFMVLSSLCATSLATMLSCICVSIDLTTVVLSVAFETSRLFAGLFIPPADMAEYPQFVWVDALSLFKYSCIGVYLNEFSGLPLTCTPQQISQNTCTFTSGNDVIETLEYDQYTIGGCIGSMIALYFGFRLIAYLALRYLKN